MTVVKDGDLSVTRPRALLEYTPVITHRLLAFGRQVQEGGGDEFGSLENFENCAWGFRQIHFGDDKCAKRPGLLQPAVALGNAALLRGRRHWHGKSPMKPSLAPLAAGCMAESGSRLPQSRDFVSNLVELRVYFWPRPLVL